MAINGSRGGRGVIGPLLVVIFVMYLIVIGLASWSLDKYINGEQHHPHLGGNPATSYMLVFALMAGVIGACSVLAGLLHYRAWRNESLAAAASPAIISWALTALAFGLACKEIGLGGHRGRRLQTLEAFIIILTVTKLVYVGLLHAGMVNSSYGPGYRQHEQYGAMGTTAAHEPEYKSSSIPVV